MSEKREMSVNIDKSMLEDSVEDMDDIVIDGLDVEDDFQGTEDDVEEDGYYLDEEEEGEVLTDEEGESLDEEEGEGTPLSSLFIEYLKDNGVEIPEGVSTYEDLVYRLLNKPKEEEADDDVKIIKEIGLDNYLREHLFGQKELTEKIEQINSFGEAELLYEYFRTLGYDEDKINDKVNRILSRSKDYVEAYVSDVKEELVSRAKKEVEFTVRDRLEKILSETKEQSKAVEEAYASFVREVDKVLPSFNRFLDFEVDDSRKKELRRFVTEMNEQGYTHFESFVQQPENLVKTAYMALYFDDIINSVYKKGYIEAQRKLLKDTTVPQQGKGKGNGGNSLNLNVMNEY